MASLNIVDFTNFDKFLASDSQVQQIEHLCGYIDGAPRLGQTTKQPLNEAVASGRTRHTLKCEKG